MNEYTAIIDNKEYVIKINKRNSDTSPENLNTITVEEDSSEICLNAVLEEYQHSVRRSEKLDNKVYILSTRDKLSRTFSSNSQKIHKKRCQKHRMASDTSFDRLHFSVQQVFAEIHIVWQLVDIWLPAPLDFRQFQRIGCFQRVIVARHI